MIANQGETMNRRSLFKTALAGGVAGGSLFVLNAVRKVLPFLPEPKPVLSDEIKSYYDQVLLTRALPNLMIPFGRDLPISVGKTIEFRRFSSLSPMTTETVSTHEFAATTDPVGVMMEPWLYSDEEVQTAVSIIDEASA